MKCNQTRANTTRPSTGVTAGGVAQIQATDHAGKGEGRALWLVSPHRASRRFGIVELWSAAPCKKRQKSLLSRAGAGTIGGFKFLTCFPSSKQSRLMLYAT
jgi:hypothetical protein